MKIIKRSGAEVAFDQRKIEAAIGKASAAAGADGISEATVRDVSSAVTQRCEALGRAVSVEEVQDMVEEELARAGHFRLMRIYSDYRHKRENVRRGNTTDGRILSLIERNNEEAKQENANKNPTINSTLRDYMAGEVSRDICRRFLFPEDIMAAHDEGIIHVHDMDYISGPLHNCCLVNLEDMLQNGTVISGTKIETPHSFSTACNIATQIIAQIASNQYGGQTITLSHLVPFVEVSRQKHRREVWEDMVELGRECNQMEVNTLAEMRLRREIERGIQTIQYQINTLLTTNG